MEKTDICTQEEAAAILHVSRKTLTNWRVKRLSKGPKFFRSGRKILYRRVDIAAWVAGEIIDPEEKQVQQPPQKIIRRPSIGLKLRETLDLPRVPRGRPRKVAQTVLTDV